jgi:hypothetical protein
LTAKDNGIMKIVSIAGLYTVTGKAIGFALEQSLHVVAIVYLAS